jgi:hypothetical protein
MAKISESVEVANLSELGDYIDNTPGMAIPTHDCIETTNFDGDGNISEVNYRLGGTVANRGLDGTIVATLYLTWDVTGNPMSIFITKP